MAGNRLLGKHEYRCIIVAELPAILVAGCFFVGVATFNVVDPGLEFSFSHLEVSDFEYYAIAARRTLLRRRRGRVRGGSGRICSGSLLGAASRRHQGQYYGQYYREGNSSRCHRLHTGSQMLSNWHCSCRGGRLQARRLSTNRDPVGARTMPGSRASATLVQELAAVNVKTFALRTVKT